MCVSRSGCYLAPGFVDIHVHLTGGGGEQGPASRTGEAKMTELVAGGVTTAIGALLLSARVIVRSGAVGASGVPTCAWRMMLRAVYGGMPRYGGLQSLTVVLRASQV